ncbi:hypothetical protein SDC9_202221 [bioreactor metagenome]|uniref:UDP-2,3-diacylglucosamine diphosphatase n=1 Tax=bioreactor metagenome TaxID=1076179 RepID=A0A645IUI4_9ZZZZ
MKDGMLDFAKSKINEGYDFVVMGHRHLAEKTFYQLENHQGTYVNLGEWIENPHYGKFDGKQFELIKL